MKRPIALSVTANNPPTPKKNTHFCFKNWHVLFLSFIQSHAASKELALKWHSLQQTQYDVQTLSTHTSSPTSHWCSKGHSHFTHLSPTGHRQPECHPPQILRWPLHGWVLPRNAAGHPRRWRRWNTHWGHCSGSLLARPPWSWWEANKLSQISHSVGWKSRPKCRLVTNLTA